jgi:hypothetical protein
MCHPQCRHFIDTKAKNERARSILCKISGDCVWMNIHTLPHDVHVFEIRNSLGYGARWTADGLVFFAVFKSISNPLGNSAHTQDFRGFLEPQMEDGHERGWRH